MEKKKLLFIHGFGSNKNFWIPLKKLERNYEMITLTLELNNESSVLKFGDQVRQYIDENDLTDLIVVGHSLGCSVAFTLADHPSVKKLILLSPHNAFIENENDTKKWVIPNTIEESIESFENLVHDNRIWKTPVKKMANNYLAFVNDNRKALTNLFDTSLFNAEFKKWLIHRYETTNIPVAIMSGDEDCFVSAKSVKQFLKYGFEVNVLQKVGHAILTEKAEEVNNFINREVAE